MGFKELGKFDKGALQKTVKKTTRLPQKKTICIPPKTKKGEIKNWHK